VRTVAGPELLLARRADRGGGVIAANAVSCPAALPDRPRPRSGLTGIYLGQAVVAIVAVTASAANTAPG